MRTQRSMLPLIFALLVGAAPCALFGQDETADSQPLTPEELERLVAPIALYPDPLIAQVLMASTYPLEIVEAARWSKANPTVTGDAIPDAMTKQSWDPSVKSLVPFPDLITMMSDKLDWTQKLGDAFLAQQADVMSAIQRLRAKAQAEGNLKSSKEQTVTTEGTASPRRRPLPRRTRPRRLQRARRLRRPGSCDNDRHQDRADRSAGRLRADLQPDRRLRSLAVSGLPAVLPLPAGLRLGRLVLLVHGRRRVGSALWGNCNWGGGDVDINVNNYNNFNRVNTNREVNNNRINTNQAGQGKWQHDPSHRKGVEYGNSATQQKFGESRSPAAVQSREAFRGHAEQGRQELARGGAATDSLGGQPRATQGGGAQTRAPGAESRAGGQASPANRATPSAGSANRATPTTGSANRSYGSSSVGSELSSSVGSSTRGPEAYSGMSSGSTTRTQSQRGSASRSSAGMSRGGGGGGRRR